MVLAEHILIIRICYHENGGKGKAPSALIQERKILFRFRVFRRKLPPTKQTIKIKSDDYFLIVLVKSNFRLDLSLFCFPITVTQKLQNLKLQVPFPFHYFTLA